MFKRLLDNSKQILADNICFGCFEKSKNNLCENCLQNIKQPDYWCNICGYEILEETSTQVCNNCLKKPPNFNKINYIGTYELTLKDLINRAKNNKDIKALSALNYLLEIRLSNFIENLVENTKENSNENNKQNNKQINLLPMPTPVSRMMFRGYNLPRLLAKNIKRNLRNKGINLNIISENKVTLPFYLKRQTKMNLKQRINNKHNFKINSKLPQDIVIFDDVVTTTNTVSELSKNLKKQGVKNISIWALSRGVMH